MPELLLACSQGIQCSAQHLLQRRCIGAAQDPPFFQVRRDATFQGSDPRFYP